MAHAFLSDAWLDAAREVAQEAGGGLLPDSVTLNLVVTGGPEGDREIHTAGGSFGTGLLDDAPTKVTLPYDVAKSMFIEGNPQAAMQAFMSGQIKVEGDMTKLMAMQSGGHGGDAAAAAALQQKLKDITAD